MTTGYHNIRWWRVDPSLPWQAVGANDRHLIPMCASVGAGIIPVLYVRCYNGCTVTLRPVRKDLLPIAEFFDECNRHYDSFR